MAFPGYELCTAKLASSGLTIEDAKCLKIKLLDGPSTAKLHPILKPLSSLQFNYLAPNGDALSWWPNCPPFYRIRYVQKDMSFSGHTEKKEIRYVQLPGTMPVAYYPNGFFDWVEVAIDPSIPLIITEGELKAAKACKEGFPTIGLGGVWSWCAQQHGIQWLDSLELVEWRQRLVYVCFDSDYHTNQQVCHALVALTKQLVQLGAYVKLVALPELADGTKTGLDDFLLFYGAAGREELSRLLDQAVSLGLSKPLWDFNRRFAYVYHPGLVVALEDPEVRFSASTFKESEGRKSYMEATLAKDGEIKKKQVAVAPSWLTWEQRHTVDKIIYSPGHSRLHDNCYNAWTGWGIKPEAGDVKPFLDLVDHLFTDAEPEAKQWFLRWCAYPLQHPGFKLATSVLLHGIRQGTGKSLLGYTLGAIYGQNFIEIKQADLHSSFNSWAANKQFVMGDDVAGSNKRQDADLLKKMITQRQIEVNIKWLPTYVVQDCINYLFTSNHPDAFFLEGDDRRFFVHQIYVGPLSEEFYVEYDLWLSTGGAAAVFDHLLNLDLGDFNPTAPAFRTSARDRLIDCMQSDLGSWCRELISAPDQVLRVGDIVLTQDLFSSRELLRLYDPTGINRVTANGISRELARAGLRQVYGGRPILANGVQARYFAVRNPERWASASPRAVIEHLQEHHEKALKPDAPKY